MKTIAEWCDLITEWRQAKGFKTEKSNMPEKLMLVVSELSEALEAIRNNKWQYDDGPDNFAEEIADTTIRIFDICGALRIDLDWEITKKMQKNFGRPEKHGKAF